MTTHKSKFNKHKCAKCQYMGKASVSYGSRATGGIYCDYGNRTGQTCIYRSGREILDRRGDDFNNCKLYERAKK